MTSNIQQMAASVKSWSSGILQLKVGVDMNSSLFVTFRFYNIKLYIQFKC